MTPVPAFGHSGVHPRIPFPIPKPQSQIRNSHPPNPKRPPCRIHPTPPKLSPLRPPISHLPSPDSSLQTPNSPVMKPKAVIFDMDGVLTDSEPLINEAAVAMFRERGVNVAPDDFLPFVGTGENRYIGGVAEKHGVTLDIEQAKHRTYEIYLGLVPAKLHAFPGAVEKAREFRHAGFRLAVASSADLIKIQANLDRIGLPVSWWESVVSAEDAVHKKPAPDLFLAAARKLGVEPDQCVVIEDAVNGVQAALAAGMKCIAVAQTFPAERLSAAHRVCPTLASIRLQDLVFP